MCLRVQARVAIRRIAHANFQWIWNQTTQQGSSASVDVDSCIKRHLVVAAAAAAAAVAVVVSVVSSAS